jgi:hypothetical protein
VTPSPAREARTNIAWIGAELPREKDAGYAARSLPVKALFTEEHKVEDLVLGRPAIVFFYSALDDDDLMAFEAKVFGDERVAVGSRFFNCVRICLDDMRSAADRKHYGKKSPSIHLMDPEGKLLKRFDGTRTTGHRLYKSMEAVIKRHYKANLFDLLRKEGEILKVLDETYWDLKTIEEDMKSTKAHLDEHNCAMGRKQLAELEADLKMVKKERDKALAAEKELFDRYEVSPTGRK